MGKGEGIPSSVEVLVNYWEYSTPRLLELVERLRARGIRRLTAFVPWSQFETDITHSLHRFLQAALDHELVVSLMITPELGVSFPHSAIPKELSAEPGCWARNQEGASRMWFGPPTVVAIPSLVNPLVLDRFLSVANKIFALLAALCRQRPEASRLIRCRISSSFLKEIRDIDTRVSSWFSDSNFDFSAESRDELASFQETLLGTHDVEICDQPQQARCLEEAYKAYFESLFRFRVAQVAERKRVPIELSQVEIFIPEFDLKSQAEELLALATGKRLPPEHYLRALRELAPYGGPDRPWVCLWTHQLGFSRLRDAERQFCILESILELAPRGGTVVVSAEEWLRFSSGFHAKANVLFRSLSGGEFLREGKFLAIVAHWMSAPSRLIEAGIARLGGDAWDVRDHWSRKLFQGDVAGKLFIVGGNQLITKRQLTFMCQALEAGMFLVLEPGSWFTKRAREDWDALLSVLECHEDHRNIPFRCYEMKSSRDRNSIHAPFGKIFLIDRDLRDLEDVQLAWLWDQMISWASIYERPGSFPTKTRDEALEFLPFEAPSDRAPSGAVIRERVLLLAKSKNANIRIWSNSSRESVSVFPLINIGENPQSPSQWLAKDGMSLLVSGASAAESLVPISSSEPVSVPSFGLISLLFEESRGADL